MNLQIPNQDRQNPDLNLRLAFMGTAASTNILNELRSRYEICELSSLDALQRHMADQLVHTLPEVILIETDQDGAFFDFIERIKTNPSWCDLIVVIIANELEPAWKTRALQLRVHDYYTQPFPIAHLIERLNFLVKFKLIKPQLG